MTDAAKSFADHLRVMAQGNATLDIAQFAFVGLEDVARAYGDRWPAQKARVLDIAHTYLSKRLGPADVLIKGGGGFIVVSGSGSGPEPGIAAASLAHGLNDFFLGMVDEAPPPRMDVESRSVDIEALAKALGDVPFVVAPASISEPSLVATGIEWRFHPVWDVRREALGNYSLVPYLKHTQTRLVGYQFESAEGPPRSLIVVDETALWLAEQATRDLFQSGGRALVGATVNSSSVANVTSRARLFAVMEKFDQKLLRYKTIKIANVMPGFPRMYLTEIIGAVRHRVPNVFISAAWDEPDIAGLLQAGPAAIGFALPQSVLASNSLVTPAQLLSKIRSAADTAHASKKLFFVEGNITREFAVRLSAMGVDTISSPLIWPASDAPKNAVKWPADKLLTS